MPLKPGSSKETISKNISEFHTGKTYARTAAKFGKAKANKQAIAVALSTARKYGKKAGGMVLDRPDSDIKIQDGPEEGTDAYYAEQERLRGVPESERYYGAPEPVSRRPLPRRGRPLIPKAGGGASTLSNMALKGSTIKLSREGMLNSSIPGRTDKLPMKVKAGSYVLPADIPSALGQGNTMAGGEILKKMFSSGAYGLSPMKGGRGSIRPRLKADGGEAEPPENEGDDHVPIIAAGGEYIIPPEVVQDIGHGNMKAGHDVLDKFVLKVRKHHIQTLRKLPPPKK